MADLWCLGVYESREAGYFPLFAPPILAEQGAGGWRRIRYRIGRPYVIQPFSESRPFEPLKELSVFRGDYITCRPTRFELTDMALIVPGPSVLLVGRLDDCLFGLVAGARGRNARAPWYWRAAFEALCDYIHARQPAHKRDIW
jgi:hypothetical protein